MKNKDEPAERNDSYLLLFAIQNNINIISSFGIITKGTGVRVLRGKVIEKLIFHLNVSA